MRHQVSFELKLVFEEQKDALTATIKRGLIWLQEFDSKFPGKKGTVYVVRLLSRNFSDFFEPCLYSTKNTKLDSSYPHKLTQRAVQRKFEGNLRERGAVHFYQGREELGKKRGVYRSAVFARQVLQYF